MARSKRLIYSFLKFLHFAQTKSFWVRCRHGGAIWKGRLDFGPFVFGECLRTVFCRIARGHVLRTAPGVLSGTHYGHAVVAEGVGGQRFARRVSMLWCPARRYTFNGDLRRVRGMAGGDQRCTQPADKRERQSVRGPSFEAGGDRSKMGTGDVREDKTVAISPDGADQTRNDVWQSPCNFQKGEFKDSLDGATGPEEGFNRFWWLLD